MLNFLFGILCAGGAVFGALLTYTGILNHSYEGVIAGGLFLFGSLLTFGIGQITRSMALRQTRVVRVREKYRAPALQRVEPGERPEPVLAAETPPRLEPEAFPGRPQGDSPTPHPILEKVASRFARAGN